jgi:hypothetical protein
VIKLQSNLIIVPPKWEDGLEKKENRQKCKILFIPDTAAALLQFYQAESVVSYGLSDKSTLTPSSISEHETVISIQRELPTIDGDLLEQQEIALKRPEDMPVEKFLAIVGALLITGIPPEKLGEFF